MKDFLDAISIFIFGKYLKLVLFVLGMIFCIITINPYRNPPSEVIGTNIRYGLTAMGLIIASILLHVNERGRTK